MKNIAEGIIGTDPAAKPCPYCGCEPRIHVHTFRMRDDSGRIVCVRKSYYDCSVCGCAVTDWTEDPMVAGKRSVAYAGYGARKLWDSGKFIGGI